MITLNNIYKDYDNKFQHTVKASLFLSWVPAGGK